MTKIIIFTHENFIVPAWQEAWPQAVIITKKNPLLPAAKLAVILAGSPNWQDNIKHYVQAQTAVLVLSANSTLDELQQAFSQGARGYIDLLSSVEQLKTAAQSILNGALWIPSLLLNNLIGFVSQNLTPKPEADIFKELTEREQQVAKAACRGLSNKQISEELTITERTVKMHLSSVFQKLNISDRMQLLVLSQTGS